MNRVWSALGALAVLLGAAGPALAQDWPQRPIRLVVGFGPGGGTDILARILAPTLQGILGQPVVVENKPGAGGTVGAESVARAAPDGHVAFVMNNGHAVSAVLYKSLPFDAVADFAPVAMVATMPLVVVADKGFAGRSVGDLVAAAKAQPGKLNFASVGVGSSQHFAAELLRQLSGIDMVHVPYRGTPAAILAMRNGETQMLVEVAAAVLGQVRAGDLKALAVTSAARFPILPEVPTVAESGLAGYDVATWYAIALPAKTPRATVDKFNAAVRRALADEATRKRMLDAAFLPETGTPEGLGAHLGAEIAKWARVRDAARIELQ
ncbi:MAG: tripartite tricarboxylate transporter substrate binding protein [Alphaproteobacteria bacterium]|nr:tripartite tricarboxylate transporter substrate binding protein [Alphaproteobacteria bacterium]